MPLKNMFGQWCRVCLLGPVQANQKCAHVKMLNTNSIYDRESNERRCKPATILTVLCLHHRYNQDNQHVSMASASR